MRPTAGGLDLLQNSLRNAIDPWVIGAILLLLGIYFFYAYEISRGFVLHDSDDYMRLVQVQDLLAGQSWWSVDQKRLHSPEGGAMHWSRLPDLPLAALVLALELFVSSPRAVELAAIIWPGFLLLAGAGVSAALARALCLSSAGSAIAIVLALAIPDQINPGRVDHHGLVIIATLAMLGGLAGRQNLAVCGTLAGGAITVMLTVAIESLPFAGIGIAAAGLLWVWRGQVETARLRAFGAALAIGALLAYGLDAPGPFWARRAVCDAFGNAHAAVLVLAGAGYWAMSQQFFAHTIFRRVLAVAVLGAFCLLAVVLIQPDCLRNPYAKVDPEAERFWLQYVSEYMGLEAWWETDKSKVIAVFGYAIAVCIGFAGCIRSIPRQSVGGWAVLFACAFAACLVSTWQLRASSFMYAFLAFATGFLISQALASWQEKRGFLRVSVFAMALFVASPIGWTAFARPFAPQTQRLQTAHEQREASCWGANALVAFRAVPADRPSRLLADVDLGPLILFATPHSVLGAGYHRNGKGIASVFKLMALPVLQSQAALADARIDYLLYCRHHGWRVGAREGGADSLAAALIADEAPDWLAPIELPANQADIRLYRVSR